MTPKKIYDNYSQKLNESDFWIEYIVLYISGQNLN